MTGDRRGPLRCNGRGQGQIRGMRQTRQGTVSLSLIEHEPKGWLRGCGFRVPPPQVSGMQRSQGLRWACLIFLIFRTGLFPHAPPYQARSGQANSPRCLVSFPFLPPTAFGRCRK